MIAKQSNVKSSQAQLEKRGYIRSIPAIYAQKNETEYFALLHSNNAMERSYAARALLEYIYLESVSANLIQAFIKEKALYTRIEIANTLQQGNQHTLAMLFPHLATLPNKQHKTLPDGVSKKKTYLLPRDGIARIIAHMDASYLPICIQQLKKCTILQARELIDAIGFLCYHNNCAKVEDYQQLQGYFNTIDDVVCKWKLIMCFAAYWPYSEAQLTQISQQDNFYALEAQRAINLAKKPTK